MYEPRGHAAMSGAILQPPTRPDADCGVLYIEVSGLPADVRPRHHRRGHRAGRDRHGRGGRAGHHHPARHPGRASSSPRSQVEDGAATAVTIHNVPSFARRARRDGRRCPASARSATTWPTAATSTPSSTLDDARPAVRPRRARSEHPRRRAWRSWTPINAQRPAGAPRRPGDPRLPPRLPRRARLGRRGTPGTRWPSTPAGSTARRAAPAPRARMAQLHARGELAAAHRLRQRVLHRPGVHRPAGRSDQVGPDARWCRPSPAGPGSPAPPSTCSTRRPVPGRLPAVSGRSAARIRARAGRRTASREAVG